MTQEPPQSWPQGPDPSPWAPPHRVDPLSGLPIEQPPTNHQAPDQQEPLPQAPAYPQTAPYPQAVQYPEAPPYPEPPPYPQTAPYPEPPYGEYPGPYAEFAAPYPPQHQAAPYYPPPYGPSPYAWQAQRPTNGMAIASMVLGILWVYWLGSILALVFGYIARNQIRQRGENGDGMAIAGLVLGWVGIGVLALIFLFFGTAAVVGSR
jgi:hypothetical protein